MTRAFVDTSAILALVVRTDAAHERARIGFERLRAREVALVTTSYVLVELYALAARRLGLPAVARIRALVSPLLEVIWVGSDLHEQGLDLLLERAETGLSLVDAISFLTMRAHGIEEVFAYDQHFENEGFTVVS